MFFLNCFFFKKKIEDSNEIFEEWMISLSSNVI